MTDHPLFGRLLPVRQRQQNLQIFTSMTWGLFGGACLAIGASILRLTGQSVGLSTIAWLLAGGMLAGLLVGLVRRMTWKHAASAVDSRYDLKDRTVTALEFCEKSERTAIHQLQISDATEHLTCVDPREVTPFHVPRALSYALVASIACFALFLIPIGTEQATAAPTTPLDHIVAEADRLEQEMLDDLEEIQKETKDEEFEKLVKELKELVKEMKKPGVDEREAIAKLSEMQAAISAMQQEYDTTQMDASLQSVGEAFSAATALEKSAEALQNQNYDKASAELSKVDFEQLSRKESKSVQDKLAKLAKDLEQGNPGNELSQCLNGMCEGLKDKNSSQCKSNCNKLGMLCKKQSLRKKIGNCLGSQLNLLSECKGNCNKSGYNKNVSLSNKPSTNWGTGESNKPLGERTDDLAGTRNRDDLTGIAGDGPSEKEVSHSPEGRQDSARSYREVFNEYQKMSEAVLESEPFPLGQRQIIRNYFEGIRPQNAELDSVFKSPTESGENR